MKLGPAVFPWQGLRGVDAWGAGGFGAPRGSRVHRGLDELALPNDAALAVITGVVTRHAGIVYSHTPALRYIEITGVDEYAPYRTRVHYTAAGCHIIPNTRVRRGEQIGIVQDISGYWAERIKNIDEEWARKLVRSGALMPNHVHVELYHEDGTILDPTKYLEPDLRAVA